MAHLPKCIAFVAAAIAILAPMALAQSKTTLPGNATFSSPDVTVDLLYAYQFVPRALALNLTATVPMKNLNLGFIEFRLELNSTTWQVFQMSLTSTSTCVVPRLAMLNATTGTFDIVPNSDAVSEVKSYAIAAPDLWNTTAEIWLYPVPALAGGLAPRLNVSIGTLQLTERTTCGVYNPVATAVVDASVTSFSPFGNTIVKSSTNCWYGAPSFVYPYDCQAPCYLGYSPTTTCQFLQTTPPPPTTTVLANLTTAMPTGNFTGSVAPTNTTAPTTTVAPTSNASTTTAAPGQSITVWVISLTVRGDVSTFSSANFSALVARLLNIPTLRIIVLGAVAGTPTAQRQTATTTIRFYISDATTGGTQDALTDAFLTTVVVDPEFTAMYEVVGTPGKTQELVTTSPQTSGAPITEPDTDDDGLSGVQILIILVIVLLFIGAIVGGIVYYVRSSKKESTSRTQQYGTEMDHVTPSN